jgi:peroxiredoxin
MVLSIVETLRSWIARGTYFGNERTTFVIGTDGTVVKVLRKVKPGEHDALVLVALEELSPPVI